MSNRHSEKLPYWSKVHWGDYYRYTHRLPGELHAAFLNLLRVYLSETGPLPMDEQRIFELAGVTSAAAKDGIRAVLRLLFRRDDADGLLHNDFADEIIAVAIEAREKQSMRARKGMQGRQRNERGRVVQVPRNQKDPATAGEQLAEAESRPAMGGDKPPVGGLDPAIQIQDPEILEPRSEIHRSLEPHLTSTSSDTEKLNASEEFSLSCVNSGISAPPKRDQVGADIDTSGSTAAQLQAEGPHASAPPEGPPLPELSHKDMERIRRRAENDELFAAMPKWAQVEIVLDRQGVMDGGLVLTPREREDLESRCVAMLFARTMDEPAEMPEPLEMSA